MADKGERLERPLRDALLERGQALFSGRIDVDTGGMAGVVHMSDGIVIDARIGSVSGEPALWRLLLHERPKLTVEPGRPKATGGAVLGKPDALLPRFDERFSLLERYAEKVGGFGRIWALRFDALAQVLEDLPDAINPVLRLLDGKRSVRQVVTESPLDDVLALRILARLLALGVLVLPDDVVQRTAPSVIDVDEGLEAALASSLATMDDDDKPSLPAELSSSDDAYDFGPNEVTDPDMAIPLLKAKGQTSEPPGSSMPMPAPAASTSSEPPAAPPPSANAAPTVVEEAKPVPPEALRDSPRDVTMMPKAVTYPPDVTLPVVTALPSAPPIKSDDLKGWLGSEEAFFQSEVRGKFVSGDVTPPPSKTGLGWIPMVLLFLGAVGLGMLISQRGC